MGDLRGKNERSDKYDRYRDKSKDRDIIGTLAPEENLLETNMIETEETEIGMREEMIVIFVTDPETGSEMTIERNLTEIVMREKALVIDMMRIKIETRWKAKTMKEVFIIPHLKKTEVIRNPRKRKRQRNRRRKKK